MPLLKRWLLRFIAPAILCANAMVVVPVDQASAQSPQTSRPFDIAAGSLLSGLRQYARQSDVDLIYKTDDVAKATTAGVRGRMSSEEALRRLLRDTGFTFRTDGSGAIAIVALRRSPGSGASARARRPAPTARPPSAGALMPLTPIIVTARRTEEALQDVPAFVSAIGSEELVRNSATNLAKVAELIPQTMIGEFGSGTGATLTIRGIGTDAIDFGLDQSVLVVVDDVPISNGSIIRQSLFDIERIEVMPGPQTLFFGKNSVAGVIAVHTAEPTDYLSGYAKAGHEFEANERFVEGALSGPLAENFNARLAMRFSDMDGWLRNGARSVTSPFDGVLVPAGSESGALPDEVHEAGRLSLAWRPAHDLDIDIKWTADRQRLGGNGNLAFYEAWCADENSVPTTRGVEQANADCAKDGRVAFGAYPERYAANFPYARGGTPYRENKIMLGALTIQKRWRDATLTSTTGYYRQNHVGTSCSDGVYCQLFSSIRTGHELTSQELRLEINKKRLALMAGLYFEQSSRSWYSAVDLFHVYNPAADNYVSFATRADDKHHGVSIFGQLRWDVTDEIELATGGRFSRDSKRAEVLNALVNEDAAAATALSLLPQGQRIDVDIADDDFSPEMTLRWKPDSSHSFYATYKSGYKSGGVSNPSILYDFSTADTLRFGREKAWGMELGYKATLPSSGLRLNLSLYQYEIDDLQVISENANLFVFQIGNAARARVRGIEAWGIWQATPRLRLNGNFSYNDGIYLSYPAVQCYPGQSAAKGCVGGVQDLSGQPLPRAPDMTVQLGGEYSVPLPGDWGLDLSVNAFHSSSYQGSTTANPYGIQPAFWRLNAGIGLASPDERFRMQLIGRNLTDTYYLTSMNNLPLGGERDFFSPFARPREVILQMEYLF